MCGVTVAVLQPLGCLHTLFEVLYPDHAEYRHHQLLADQRMLLGSFECDASDVCSHSHSCHGKKCPGVASHTVSVERSLRVQYSGHESVLYGLVRQIASVLGYHIVHQLIADAVLCHYLLFCDAGEIVVEGTSVHYVSCSLPHIGGSIHECGRVACSCS